MIEFKKLTYEVLQVGEEFTSNDHVVTPEDIEAYAFAVDDHDPWFTGCMEFEFLEPLRPGMRVRSYGRVVDKYERRGKPYMVTEFTTQAEDGTVLVRGRFVQMLFRD